MTEVPFFTADEARRLREAGGDLAVVAAVATEAADRAATAGGRCTCANDGNASRCPHHTQADFDAASAARDNGDTATYRHALYVSIGGTAKMPTVSLWCSDCIVTVQDFGQNNEWDALQRAVREHCSQMSRREQLSRIEPEGGELRD
jgi:hypothetical protein